MLTVREVDPATERENILGVLQSELPDWGDQAKFGWLYLDNPLGRAKVWALVDEGGCMVGVSAAFPRRLRAGGRVFSAWVLGDFCVAATHRSLGPAVMLQRAAHEAVDRGRLDVWYDFPSRVMMAVHQRIGIDRSGELVRFVRPTRVDDVVEEKFGAHSVSRGLSAVGNALLAVGAGMASRDPAWVMRTRESDFTRSEVTDAADEGVWLVKDAEYLNWRYRRDPRCGVQIVDTERNGEVGGSLVYHVDDDHIALVDAVGIESIAALRELVLAVVGDAINRGAQRVTVAMTKEHSWRDLFESLGFRARESVPYVAYGAEEATSEVARWSLMGGDRDS